MRQLVIFMNGTERNVLLCLHSALHLAALCVDIT